MQKADKSLQAVLRLYTAATELLNRSENELLSSRQNISSWSPAQHMFHIVRSNDTILGYLHDIRTGQGDEGAGGSSALGYAMLLIGRIPRGRAQAARSIRPPEQCSIPELAGEWQRSKTAFKALEQHLDTFARALQRRHHSVFGHLSAVQWLRFTEIHTGHHLRIIDDILR